MQKVPTTTKPNPDKQVNVMVTSACKRALPLPNIFTDAKARKKQAPYIPRDDTRRSKAYRAMPMCEHDFDPFGNRTPARSLRGKRAEVVRLKDMRCYVPYDGFCGYHTIGKLFQMTVLEVLQYLKEWADPDNARGFLTNPCFSLEQDRKETHTRVAGALLSLQTKGEGVVIMEEFYATGCMFMVLACLKNKRVLVLDDCTSEFEGNDVTDYMVTPDGVQFYGDLDLGVHTISRGADYDHLVIHERNHWTYALPHPKS
jgi:hypothetical protein